MVAEGIQLSIDYPGNVGILCRQDMPSFKRTVLVELEKYQDAGIWVNDGGKETFEKLIIQHHQTDHTFTVFAGKGKPTSTIWYTGLGDDTRGLASKMGMTLGWFGIDQVEEVNEIHFSNLMGRLSINIPGIRYKALLTANPMPGWVKSRFIESTPDDFVYIPSLPRDNPYLPEDYEENLRKMYPEELVSAWLEGNWDVMEGGNFLFKESEIKKAINKELDD
uniref:Putative terminase n=1 Tax=viral metagenome TaxID=1070528 RepID=A0A6M3K4T4_9ZZZZ